VIDPTPILDEGDEVIVASPKSTGASYFWLLVFVVIPLSAVAYYSYGGGKEQLKKWSNKRKYERVDSGRA